MGVRTSLSSPTSWASFTHCPTLSVLLVCVNNSEEGRSSRREL